MRAFERLLRYVTVSTASDENGTGTPSAKREFDLAIPLRDELISLGIPAETDGHCYVYATLPATPGFEKIPTVGFIAHIDTSPDFSGEGVKVRMIPDYDGGEVILGESGRVLSPAMFPHLPGLAGRTLLVTDGTTLLGADDKAGVAEIMTMLETVIAEGIPHGRIAVCFTPDEEIGGGTACFDLPRFGADFAYTVDGGQEGEVVYENFNAASATVTFSGVNVHPGSAKNVMVNAQLLAMEFNAALPPDAIPSKTDGYEGFYHLTGMSGSVEEATLSYIIRDHDLDAFRAKKAFLTSLAAKMNERYGKGRVSLAIREQYRNMKEKILPVFSIVETALAATRDLGLTPSTEPIRGGTDGAMLTWSGLPCPNLGTGGWAFHGPYEHITVEGMDLATGVLLGIVRRVAEARR